MNKITNQKLIELAVATVNPMKLGYDNTAGGVGSVLVSNEGKIYAGVCIDANAGYCAEQNAIGSMITAGESGIKKIVAVSKDAKTGTMYILPPCGNCRELMYQINPENLDIEVVTGPADSVKLMDLLPLPYRQNRTKIKI